MTLLISNKLIYFLKNVNQFLNKTFEFLNCFLTFFWQQNLATSSKTIKIKLRFLPKKLEKNFYFFHQFGNLQFISYLSFCFLFLKIHISKYYSNTIRHCSKQFHHTNKSYKYSDPLVSLSRTHSFQPDNTYNYSNNPLSLLNSSISLHYCKPNESHSPPYRHTSCPDSTEL